MNVVALPTGRRRGRPVKSAYVKGTGRPEGALSRRVEAALCTLTQTQIESIRALAEDRDCRIASIASIALGVGFDEPGSTGAMKVRVAAHELLARMVGDLTLGPPTINAQVESPRVVFVRPDAPTPPAAELPEQAAAAKG